MTQEEFNQKQQNNEVELVQAQMPQQAPAPYTLADLKQQLDTYLPFLEQLRRNGITPSAPTAAEIISALGYTPEDSAHKVTNVTGASDTNYLSEKAVYAYFQNNVPVITPYSASSNTLFGDGGSYSKNVASPTKLLELTLPYAGTFRVNVQICYGYYSGNGHYQIYKNGVAIGSAKNFTSSAYSGSDDISNCKSGDRIQVYVWSDDPTKSVTISPLSGNYGLYVCGSINWNLASF